MIRYARCQTCLSIVGVTWRGLLKAHKVHIGDDVTDEVCAGSGSKAMVYGKFTDPVEKFTDRALVDELKKRGYTVFKSSFPELKVSGR